MRTRELGDREGVVPEAPANPDRLMELHDRLDELEADPRAGWWHLYTPVLLAVGGVLALTVSVTSAGLEGPKPLTVVFGVMGVVYLGGCAFFLRRVLRARREIREVRREIRALAPEALDASRTEGWRSWLPPIPDRVMAGKNVIGLVGAGAVGAWMADTGDPWLMYGVILVAGGVMLAWKEWTGSEADPDTAREET